MIKSPTKPHPRHCEQSEAIQSPDCRAANAPRNNAPDRLSAAKKFADQLSEVRLREMAQSYSKRWTPAARTRKRQIIQSVKPWLRSTGPKCGRKTDHDLALRYALKYQQRFLQALNLLHRLETGGWKGADLPKMKQDCVRMGQTATVLLLLAGYVTNRNNE